MRPVMQTAFGYPRGNCLQAAIASILEVDLDQVPPSWVGDGSGFNEWGNLWAIRLNNQLQMSWGLSYIEVDVDLTAEGVMRPSCAPLPIGAHVILCGLTREGIGHACVGQALPHTDGGVQLLCVHNPNPNAVITSIQAMGLLIRL